MNKNQTLTLVSKLTPLFSIKFLRFLVNCLYSYLDIVSSPSLSKCANKSNISCLFGNVVPTIRVKYFNVSENSNLVNLPSPLLSNLSNNFIKKSYTLIGNTLLTRRTYSWSFIWTYILIPNNLPYNYYYKNQLNCQEITNFYYLYILKNHKFASQIPKVHVSIIPHQLLQSCNPIIDWI